MKNAEVMSAPNDATKEAAEQWQAEQAARKAAEEKSLKSEVVQEREPLKIIPKEPQREPLKITKKEDIRTNQQIADMSEFKKWCTDKNIEATKRHAGEYRGEFEKYLENKKKNEAELETTQHKEAA